MLPITVVIPVLNEETNLLTCLSALSGEFVEFIVVDSGSTDRTREIAESSGATLLDFVWDGKFPKKRNWVLRNHSFKTDWVLFLDADERVTPSFLEELGNTITDTPHVGFWISFQNWFMGSPLSHGDVFRKLALFKIGCGEYEKFPEDSWSKLDMEVHEHPVLRGSVGEIRAKLEHHDYRGLKHFISKHNEYSSWEAERFWWLRKAGPEAWENLNSRQKFKYRNLDKWWLCWVYVASAYIFKTGFLDGKPGLIFSSLKLRYFVEIRLKILENEVEDKPNQTRAH